MVTSPIHSIPPNKGAAVEWWMYQVCKRLTQYEPHIISICAENEPELEEQSGVTIHQIRFGRIYKRMFQKITRLDPLPYAVRVHQVISQLGADIVHIHNTPLLFSELENLGKSNARKYVLHMHNEKQYPNLIDNVQLLVCSEYLENYYRQLLPKARIQIIPNGVDIHRIQPKWNLKGAPEYKNLSAKIPQKSKVILYAGRISPEKGTLRLVKAFAELRKRRQDVFLLLAGEFAKRENNDRTVYGNLVRSDCERMHGYCEMLGSVPPGEMQGIYHFADLAVVPSEFEEPFGMVAIEAMAAGVPVLVAKKGGLVEFIEERRTGIFIRQPDNPLDFSNQLSATLDDSQLMNEMARNARRHVEKSFTWELVARRTEEAFGSIIQ
jgi:UDP-glucose:(glucosyl)LPS alpha-1,2-glucosyltransferase